jgi:hypothetical protein
MPRGSKLAVVVTHPYILMPHLLFSPYILPCVWTKKKRWMKKGESKKKKRKIGSDTKMLKVLPFLPP